MKTIKELNERRIPIVRINNSLKKYKTLPVFQEKVDKANVMLSIIGLPKSEVKIQRNSNKGNQERKASNA